MLRRNPDLIATIAVALYLFVGVCTPAIDWYSEFRRGGWAKEEITTFIKAELRSVLRELALAIRPI